jgi:hypothetical protein
LAGNRKLGAEKDRLRTAQGGDEAAGDGVGDFHFISVSFFAIYFKVNCLPHSLASSFSAHRSVVFPAFLRGIARSGQERKPAHPTDTGAPADAEALAPAGGLKLGYC